MRTTTDLSKFGNREYRELRLILNAMIEDGLPEDFSREGVHPMFNMDSGNVFLTNDDYQVCMMEDSNKLSSFYSCPECGHEGFESDFHDGRHACCLEFIKEIKE